MPSLRTRIAFDRIVLATAQDALADAAASVATATQQLNDIQAGTLDLSAVKVGGQRFINSGGNLVAEP